MNIKITIDEKDLEQNVISILTTDAVDRVEQELFGDSRFSGMRKLYKENVQSLVRVMLKEHETEIVEKAVNEAAAILARKALPKMMEQVSK